MRRVTPPPGLALLRATAVAALLLLLWNPATTRSLASDVMVITVLLSVILHGITAGPIGAAFARRPGSAGARRTGDGVHDDGMTEEDVVS